MFHHVVCALLGSQTRPQGLLLDDFQNSGEGPWDEVGVFRGLSYNKHGGNICNFKIQIFWKSTGPEAVF